MNNVQLLGRLTKNPELRYGQTGKAICSFSVAYNRGNDEADFFECVSFDKTAETIANYVKKGQRILIDGRLQQDRWKDQQTGENRSMVKILINRFDFIEPADQNSRQSQQSQAANNAPPLPPAGSPPYGQAPVPYPGQYVPNPQPPQTPPGYPPGYMPQQPPQQQPAQQSFWLGGNAPQQQAPAPYGFPASPEDHKNNPFNPNNPPF